MSSVGSAYWDMTFHRMDELLDRDVDPDDAPPPFTVRPDAPLVAPTGCLSTLLHHGYGFSRHDVGPWRIWPYHRTVASARSYHPTEIYVVRADGVHHYDALHHGLVPLPSAPDPIGELAEASGVECEVVLALTARFIRTAFRYGDYAYRLCTQEAGLVAGNLMLVAQAMGLRPVLRHRFLDSRVNRLLGVAHGEESTLLLLALHSGRLSEMDSSCMIMPTPLGGLVDGEAFRRPAPQGDSLPLGTETIDVVAAVRARTSGGRRFLPRVEPVPAQALRTALSGVLEPFRSDLDSSPLVDGYVLVNRVDGVPQGLYRLLGDRLVRLDGPDVTEVLLALSVSTPSVNFPLISAVVFLVGDNKVAQEVFGDRGYRVLHHEAGVVAQRVCVFAAAAGMAARITNGYRADQVQKFLDDRRMPLFTIALGRIRATADHHMPIFQ